MNSVRFWAGVFFRGFVGRYTFKGNYHVSERCLGSLDTGRSILFQGSNGRSIICERVSFPHLQVESKGTMPSSNLMLRGSSLALCGLCCHRSVKFYKHLLHFYLIPVRGRHVQCFLVQHGSILLSFHGSRKEMHLTQPGSGERESGWMEGRLSQGGLVRPGSFNDQLEFPR